MDEYSLEQYRLEKISDDYERFLLDEGARERGISKELVAKFVNENRAALSGKHLAFYKNSIVALGSSDEDLFVELIKRGVVPSTCRTVEVSRA